jgi:uncharacterized protein (DUF885 family)
VRPAVVIAIAIALLTPQRALCQPRAEPASAASAALHSLLAEYWEWRLREFPEAATWLGDARYNARLTDLSPDAIERRKQYVRQTLERARAIDASKLTGQDALSRSLIVWELQLAVEGQAYPTEVFVLDQLDGPQIGLAQLVSATPFRNRADYDDYLTRLAAIPRYFDQVTALLRRGIELGWVQPTTPLRSVPDQIQGQLVGDPVRSPFYAPFERIPDVVPAGDREQLRAAARDVITRAVFPTLARFRDFVRDTYLPAGNRAIGASTLPNGAAFYRFAARQSTTTALSPDSIHRIGLAEVARIRAQMDTVMRQSGFAGSFQQFLTFLRTDPRFYYKSADELIAAYRDISKRADAGLPALFAELPRNSYGVRPFPDYEAPSQTTARYYPGSADGSRPGWFMVNTYRLDMRPKYEMEALTLHEAVPGHHLQITRAQELRGLPDYRRYVSSTAFVEGWGLYAESLGNEMPGFYADPYSRFGQLTYEMWRACRLVVDTGMHHLGWSRQRAIDFMKDNTAKSEQDIVVEIDRYIVWPGQALAYKVGELKIKELRARATRELGARFDLRRFHNALLDNGPLPLDLLEREIDRWITSEKTRT